MKPDPLAQLALNVARQRRTLEIRLRRLVLLAQWHKGKEEAGVGERHDPRAVGGK